MNTTLNRSIFTACLCLLAPLSANALEFAGYLRSGIGNSLEGGKAVVFQAAWR